MPVSSSKPQNRIPMTERSCRFWGILIYAFLKSLNMHLLTPYRIYSSRDTVSLLDVILRLPRVAEVNRDWAFRLLLLPQYTNSHLFISTDQQSPPPIAAGL